MITLRLDSDLEKKVNALAEVLGVSKSELVRKSLVAFFRQMEESHAWEAGKELFGKYSSGRSDLSSNRKAILQERLREKRNAKNPD